MESNTPEGFVDKIRSVLEFLADSGFERAVDAVYAQLEEEQKRDSERKADEGLERGDEQSDIAGHAPSIEDERRDGDTEAEIRCGRAVLTCSSPQ